MDMIQGKMEIAVKYGADVAIFVHNVVYWVEKNAANGVNFYDGRYWTYNSVSALCEMYPLWSKDQMKRLIKKCAELGVILVGNYNENKRYRTKWYTPSDEILEFYNLSKIAPCKVQNSTIGDAESPHPKCETAPPLPRVYQEETKEDTPCSPPEGDEPAPPKPKKSKREAQEAPAWKPEKFADFWQAYPCGRSKQAAIRAWDKLRPDDALLHTMAVGLKRAMKREDWRRGIGIPHASTWLNDRRWEDEDKALPAQQTEVKPARRRKYHVEVIDGEEVVCFDE